MASPTALHPADTTVPSDETFVDALCAAGPHPSLGGAADVYGWLIGSWDVRAVDYEPDGTRHESSGEWHFAWVLAGRAVQDVFIVPRREAQDVFIVPRREAQDVFIVPRREAQDASAAFRVRYGTTIRVCDPATAGWRIVWFNPATGAETHLVGRRAGADVVQDGALEDGTPIRWSFVDISPDAFTWRGETSPDGGRTWRLDAEFFCRRAAAGVSADEPDRAVNDAPSALDARGGQ